jgi:hypothetical protein
MTLNILAFTDFHGNQDAYVKAKQLIAETKPSFVIVAGDIFNHNHDRARQNLIDLANASRPIYFVPGNMDGAELATWPGVGNVHGFHGRCEYVGDVALVGLGGSPHGQFRTVFEYSEEEAKRFLEEATKSYHGGRLILVSHCPPRDTKLDKLSNGEHIGSTSVRKFVEKQKPDLVISGHVHEAQGIDKVGSTTLVNTGPAQRGNYATIALNGLITVRLLNMP